MIPLPFNLTISGSVGGIDVENDIVLNDAWVTQLVNSIGGAEFGGEARYNREGFPPNDEQGFASVAGVTVATKSGYINPSDPDEGSWQLLNLNSATFSATLAGTLAAHIWLRYVDPLHPGQFLNLPRPNNLRQCRGGYNLYWLADPSLSGTVQVDYRLRTTVPAPPPEFVIITDTDELDSDTVSEILPVAGELVASTEPDSNGDVAVFLPNIGINSGWFDAWPHDFPRPGPRQIGSGSVSMTGAVPNLGRFNGTGEPSVVGSGGSWILRWHGEPNSFAYVIHHDLDISLLARAKRWDGPSLFLHALPSIGGPGSTPISRLLQVNNTVAQPDTEPVQDHAILSVPLDATKRGHQPDYYGRWEYSHMLAPDLKWKPFKILHAASVLVDTLTATHPNTSVNLTGDYEWQEENATASVVSGWRKVEADAGGKVWRDLLSDWDDCAVDPVAFRDDAGTPSEVASWLSIRTAWYKIRKKVRSGSDIYNWNNHRRIVLRCRADESRPFTLRIHAKRPTITDLYWTDWDRQMGTGGKPSAGKYQVGSTAAFVDVPLVAPATDTTVAIDIAWLEEQLGFPASHITGYEFRDLEVGTYEFRDLKLEADTADRKVWHGIPYADDEAVVPVINGKVCCLAEAGLDSEHGITFIHRQTGSTPLSSPVPTYSPRPYPDEATGILLDESAMPTNRDITLTMGELIALIGFQEGFSAERADDAPEDIESSEWALWLDCGLSSVGDDIPASVKLTSLAVPAPLQRTWEAMATKRGLLNVQLLDGMEAADGQAVTVEGEKHSGGWEEIATGETDSNGAFRPVVPQAGIGHFEATIDGTLPSGVPAGPYYVQYRVTATGLEGEP